VLVTGTTLGKCLGDPRFICAVLGGGEGEISCCTYTVQPPATPPSDKAPPRGEDDVIWARLCLGGRILWGLAGSVGLMRCRGFVYLDSSSAT
jgi:hypothetical protein